MVTTCKRCGLSLVKQPLKDGLPLSDIQKESYRISIEKLKNVKIAEKDVIAKQRVMEGDNNRKLPKIMKNELEKYHNFGLLSLPIIWSCPIHGTIPIDDKSDI